MKTEWQESETPAPEQKTLKREIFSPKAVSAMRGEDDQEDEIPEPRLESAAMKADVSVCEHNNQNDQGKVEFYKLRGRIGEDLAQENIPDCVNLNDASGKSNFANYDLTAPQECASVKVKQRMDNGSPRYSDYANAFRGLVNPESCRNQRAAQDLCALRSKDPQAWKELVPHLPPEVAKAASPEAMAIGLSKKSTLRISSDQVAEVRAYLKEKAVMFPEDYGINPRLSEKERNSAAQRLVERIRPIDTEYDVIDMSIAAEDIQGKRLLGMN